MVTPMSNDHKYKSIARLKRSNQLETYDFPEINLIKISSFDPLP